MSGRDVLRRAAVAVLLLGVAGLVVTGLRLTDFDARTVQSTVQGAARNSDSAQNSVSVVPRPVVAAARTDTARGATLVPPASTEENLAVRELLVTRAGAVMSGDRKSWAITTPYDQSPKTKAQLALFDRLVALHPVSWAYTGQQVSVPVGESGAPGDRRLAVSLQLRYSLVDGGPTITRDQTLTVTGKAGRWWVSDLAAPGDGASAGSSSSYPQASTSPTTSSPTSTGQTSAAVDLWDLTPVMRVQGDRCLVIGSRERKAWVRWFAAHCGAASATVDAAVPGAAARPVRTLMIVPGDVKQFARLLGRTDTAGLERTAAVTIGPVRAPAEAVLMNGDAFAQLRAVGRRVVLTHELVHVATRADQTADVPTWLEEGLADEIAYRGTGLDAATIAGPAIRAARAGRFPTAFPTAEDFDASVPDSGTGGPSLAYARAWSAADAIADRAGLAKLVELHHLVATGTALDAAFQQVLGTDGADFVAVWRKHLQALAR